MTHQASEHRPPDTSSTTTPSRNGGLWLGLAALVGAACCALLPVLASAGVVAWFTGTGLGGLTGGLLALCLVVAAGVGLVMVRRRTGGGDGCTSGGCSCQE